jgi:hypothetical protein
MLNKLNKQKTASRPKAVLVIIIQQYGFMLLMLLGYGGSA